MQNTTRTQDGGPAFPIPMLPGESWDTKTYGNPNGMTLRDWMAGLAMQGIIGSIFCTPEVTFAECAGRAYGMADAMIAARKGKEES